MNTITQKTVTNALAHAGLLLDYPTADLVLQIRKWLQEYKQEFPLAGEHLSKFLSEIEDYSDSKIEEIFTRTFDMAPACNPYITAYLYGAENYERGNLMTKLNERYQEAQFPTNGELPDHLGLILKFSPHFSPEELSELLEFCLLKPVEDMYACIEHDENPYRHLISGVLEILRTVK